MPNHNIAPDLQPFLVPVGDLHPMEDNPRIGDVNVIEGSLARFGLRVPLVYRNEPGPSGKGKRKVVYAGNHRLQAAMNLGWTHVAAVNGDDLSMEEMRAFSLADNRTGDLGSYDGEILAVILQEIDSAGGGLFEATGYDLDDIQIDGPTDIPDSFGSVNVDGMTFDSECPSCGFEF